jgi:hypothetical protein
MTTLLKKVFEQVQALPDDEQDAIAARILEELEDDRRWDELFARSPHVLQAMADAALADLRSGNTEPLDLDKL